jgi:thiol:disulfide interchange protein DsbD
MTRIFLFTVLIFTSIFNQAALAQNHVKWEARFDSKTSEIVISAKIDHTWHLYSVNNAEDLGPVPTTFSFPKMRGLKLVGKMQEQAPVVDFDPNFGATVGYHENFAEFRQKVRIKKLRKISFTVFYMVCDDSQCLPPTEVELQVTLL